MATKNGQSELSRSFQGTAIGLALLCAAAPVHAQGPAPAPAPPAAPAAPGAPVPTSRAPDVPEAVVGPEAPAPTPEGPAPAPEVAPVPTPEPAQPEAAAPPEPPPPEVVAPPPAPAPELPPPGPSPEDARRGNRMRTTGIGLMASGGILAAAGFITTLAFTLKSKSSLRDQYGLEEELQHQGCSRMVDPSSDCGSLAAQLQDQKDAVHRADRGATIGGAILIGGVGVVAVGGIVYRLGIKKLRPVTTARLRLSPTYGGMLLSGQF